MSDTSPTGGCQCGAVRYALNGPVVNPHVCHCRMCQKATGGPFVALAGVALADLEITRGMLATFASSDAAERGFCAVCGTPLTFHYVGTERTNVTIGSLDDPNAVVPEWQNGIEGRLGWMAGIAALPVRSTEESTGKERLELIRASNHQFPDEGS